MKFPSKIFFTHCALYSEIELWPWVWQYGLWSFQTGDTKLEIALSKNQHTQRKLLNFEFWINGELSKSAKIRLSKSIFYIKNHPNLSQFFSLKNTNIGAQSKIGQKRAEILTLFL